MKYQNKQILLEEVAILDSQSEENYSYSYFKGKIKGVNDGRTGQSLRGAYVSGFENAFKLAMKIKKWKKLKKVCKKLVRTQAKNM